MRDIVSEAGVIASLIHKPELCFYSEHLHPNHFTDRENSYIYTAICYLAQKGVRRVDAVNIITALEERPATKPMAEYLPLSVLDEMIEMSDTLARDTPEEYKLLVDSIMNAAFKRDMHKALQRCIDLCSRPDEIDVEQRIYETIDNVMAEYSTTDETPQYKDVIDEFWDEIKTRQRDGSAGIRFKFPTLNEYVTIEKGELVIFAAEAKQGKSMLLLNCAIDLLRQDKSVLYLDSELNTRLFTARVLAHLSGVEYKRLISGDYTEEEGREIERQLAWMKTRRFTHVYIPMFDLKSLYTTVKRVDHVQNGLDVLVVDYFKWFTLNSLNCRNTLRAKQATTHGCNMLRRDGLKTAWIGQSAAKPRTGEGSTTILKGVGRKRLALEAVGIREDEDIVCSLRKRRGVYTA